MDQLQSYDSDSENASNSAPSMERKSAGPTSLAAEWEEFEKLIGTSGGPKTTPASSAANEYGGPSVKTQLPAQDAGSRNHSGTSESDKSETSHQTEDENEDEDAPNEESGSGEEDEEEEGSGASESEEDDEEVAPSKLSAATASKDSKSKDPKRSHRRSRSRSPRHRKSRSRSNSRRRHRSRSKEKRRRSRSRSRDKRKKRSRSRHRHGSSKRRSSSRHRHSRKRSHERKRSRSRSPSHGRDRGSGGGGSNFPRFREGRGGGRGRGGRGGRRESEEGGDRRGPGGPSSSAGSSGGKPLTFKEKMRQQLLETQRNLIESQLGNTADGGEPAAPAQPPIAKPLNIQALLAMGGGKATPQQALAQAMAAMHQKAQALTGVKVPEYYNMAAVNPLKYAEQIKKRKMLWSKSKDNKEADKQWSSTVFQPESGGDNQTSKFRKLMGIKPGEGSDVPIDEKITEEQLRKQEELFRQLDREYEFARMATHTHRGVGLGFQSQGLP